jgi:quercetin dioxygenase-like cupin family protein
LTGKARVFDDEGNEATAETGDVLFVPSYEKHGYENLSKETLTFVCVVPMLDKE